MRAFWPRSLHGKLTLVLLGLLVVLGVAGVVSTLVTTRMHLAEVDQSLQIDLAAQVAMAKHENLLDADGELRQEGLKELFHWLMVVNPSVEFYVLDPDGAIVGYDAAPGKVKTDHVQLAPVRDFLEYRSGDSGSHLPILGDNPRDPGRPKIFSAASIPPEGPVRGYLYIVLAGEQYETVAERLKASFVLRLSMWAGAAGLLVLTCLGFVVSRRLTSPLRNLAGRIRSFRSEKSEPIGVVVSTVTPIRMGDEGDEVRQLELAFDEMSSRIQTQMARIERIEEQRRELIANVSHDLRTPLASLQGYLETLSLRAEAISEPERSRYLEIALAQSQRLGRMVGELFDLTKLEAREVPLHLEPFSIGELVQDNVQKFSLVAAEKGIELTAEIDPELPAVSADIGLIERVLENLIENALKYTPKDGRVVVELEEESEKVLVRVADTGIGIPREDLPQIFGRYYRSRSEDCEESPGAGLGLAITSRILDLHGSSIGVESEPGLGTTFVFGLAVA